MARAASASHFLRSGGARLRHASAQQAQRRIHRRARRRRSVLEPKSCRAPVISTISVGAGINAAAARTSSGVPNGSDVPWVNTVGTVMSRQVFGAGAFGLAGRMHRIGEQRQHVHRASLVGDHHRRHAGRRRNGRRRSAGRRQGRGTGRSPRRCRPGRRPPNPTADPWAGAGGRAGCSAPPASRAGPTRRKPVAAAAIPGCRRRRGSAPPRPWRRARRVRARCPRSASRCHQTA